MIDSQHYIIDYKTSNCSFPQDAAERDMQLTAHALAYRKLYGQDEKAVRLDAMVRTNQPKVQEREATRTQADIDQFLRLPGKIGQGLNAGIFYPNENHMCNICGDREMGENW